MLTEPTAVTAQTLEEIQKHLESATANKTTHLKEWNTKQDVALTVAETLRQVQLAQSCLKSNGHKGHKDTSHHLKQSVQALKELEDADSHRPATPEQQANYRLAWSHLEDARISLCTTLYEKMRPAIGIIQGPPDLSSRPYMTKHGL